MNKKEAFVLAIACTILGALITIAVLKPIGNSESLNILHKEGTLVINKEGATYYGDCKMNTNELKALTKISQLYSSTTVYLTDVPVNSSK